MASSPPDVDYKQEVRFAVVMYGGVSLAVYINGIAQELFHLVSSTARVKARENKAVGVDELSDTQRVYRKLSYILANKDFRERCKDEANEKAAQKEPFKVPDAPDNTTIETRFVVDIMTGASAGGINAIFLAKAFANNQNIDQLKELWVNESDIELLINDKRSVSDLTLQPQKPPLSFLNSRRMYLKLLRAFDDMDKGQTETAAESRYLDETELDLFITTTDIQGLALPLRLSDSIVHERRHRNLFHLKYASPEAASGGEKDRNNFVSANNPFLAFAARCTSSFPFAFEPMKLADINEVLNTCPEYRGKSEFLGTGDNWRRFFDRTVSQAAVSIADRPYGDGGVLDNKPFSYAADMIARRQPSLPVDRKLIYIEPSPEHPENEDLEVNQVDALQSVKAALLDLPSYETIREDLQRLMERNDLITRVNDISDAIEQDLDDSRLEHPTLQDAEWESLDLAGMVQRFGIYYIPYRRLRIEAATDELTRTVVRMLKLNEDSAQHVAIRALIQAWREKTYQDKNVQQADHRLELLAQEIAGINVDTQNAEHLEKVQSKLRNWLQLNLSDAYASFVSKTAEPTEPATTNGKDTDRKTANQFLLHYDFKYWLRRLAFVRSKIDQLSQLDKVKIENGRALDATDRQEAILDRLNKFMGDLKYEDLTTDERLELKEILRLLRLRIIGLHKRLRSDARKIQNPSLTTPGSNERKFEACLKEIKLEDKTFSFLLGTLNKQGEHHSFARLRHEECVKNARQLLDDPELAKKFGAEKLSSGLEAAAVALRDALGNILKPAWQECESLLGTQHGLASLSTKEPGSQNGGNANQAKPAKSSPQVEGLRECLWHYLRKFDDYDQVRFPIMYGTDGGESDVVEVFRISPEDAPSLIDERAESKKPNGRMKLAGSSLHHFGAFLDRVWRQNDIMWGRLDGAERLITALMPYPHDTALRAALIKEAHAAILREELSAENRRQLAELMSEAMIRASSGEPIEEAIDRVMEDLTDSSPVRTRLASAMTALLEDDTAKTSDDRLVAFVKLGYRVNRRLDPKFVLNIISRSTQTIGHIFENLAEKNSLDAKSLSWIARLGQVFWGLVQVAVPNTILNNLATHWLYVLYAFELFLILGGTLLSRSEVLAFGWTAFGITAIVNVLIFLLKDEMRGRNAVRNASLLSFALTILVLSAIGLLKVLGELGLYFGDTLTPLGWLSNKADWVLVRAARLRPYVQPYLSYILGLLVVLVLVVLHFAGKLDFGRSARTIPSFKPIKLRRFKKRDMKNIHINENCGANNYRITATLSRQPPLDWIQTFEREWGKNGSSNKVRIYRDQLRFESDPQGFSKIWKELQTAISSANSAHSELAEKAKQKLEEKWREEDQRHKKELDDKWNTFGKLS